MASRSDEEVKFSSGDDEVTVVPVLLSIAAVARNSNAPSADADTGMGLSVDAVDTAFASASLFGFQGCSGLKNDALLPWLDLNR
jgi:hypothetical protein